MKQHEVIAIDLPGSVPEAWLDLSHEIYAQDPRWIPEDRESLRVELSPRNPWFARGRARAFLIPGKARLTAYFDPEIQIDGQLAGCFGDIVVGLDKDAGVELLGCAADWLRAQGAALMVGPIHMSIHQDYRTIVSMEPGGLPFPGEPYNDLSLNDVLLSAGLTVVQRYLSQLFDHRGGTAVVERCAATALRAEALGYRSVVEPIGKFLEILPAFYERNVEIFRNSYAWSSVPKESWIRSVSKLLGRACPHSSALAYAPDGEMVGFIITTPHWGPLVTQGANPRLRVEDLRYEDHAHLLGRPRTLLLKSMGISPEHRKSGVGTQIYRLAFARALDHYERAVACLIREDNYSRRFGDGLCESERWYALYGKPLR